MDIRNTLAELLEVHDCVIIPGFGGFIGSYSPARIDPVNHRFIPPSKKLLFNVNLSQNDGLLVNCLAAQTGKSYEESLLTVKEFVNNLQRQVSSPRGYPFPKIGRLFTDREGNIQFEQDSNANLLADSFGLFSFVAPPVNRNSYTEKIEQRVMAFRRQEPAFHSRFPRTLKWAAVLAVPVSAIALFAITQSGDFRIEPLNRAGILSSVLSKFSYASLVEKKSAPTGVSDDFYSYDTTSSSLSEFPEDEPFTVESVQTEHPFVIIIGAFRIEENAKRAVDEAQRNGMAEAHIFDCSPSGLFRVAMGTYPTLEEAENAMAIARAGDHPGAWLLEK